MSRRRHLVLSGGPAATAALLASACLAAAEDKVTGTLAACATPAAYGDLRAGLAALGWQDMPVTAISPAEAGLFALRPLVAKVPADVIPAPGHWRDEWAAATLAVSGWHNLGPETPPAYRAFFRSGGSVLRVDSAPLGARHMIRCQLVAAGADLPDTADAAAAATRAAGGRMPPVHWLPAATAPASPALFGEGAVYTALLSSAGIAAATGSPLAAPAGEFFFLAQTDIIFDPKLVQK